MFNDHISAESILSITICKYIYIYKTDINSFSQPFFISILTI